MFTGKIIGLLRNSFFTDAELYYSATTQIVLADLLKFTGTVLHNVTQAESTVHDHLHMVINAKLIDSIIDFTLNDTTQW